MKINYSIRSFKKATLLPASMEVCFRIPAKLCLCGPRWLVGFLPNTTTANYFLTPALPSSQLFYVCMCVCFIVNFRLLLADLTELISLLKSRDKKIILVQAILQRSTSLMLIKSSVTTTVVVAKGTLVRLLFQALQIFFLINNHSPGTKLRRCSLKNNV